MIAAPPILDIESCEDCPAYAPMTGDCLELETDGDLCPRVKEEPTQPPKVRPCPDNPLI